MVASLRNAYRTCQGGGGHGQFGRRLNQPSRCAVQPQTADKVSSFSQELRLNRSYYCNAGSEVYLTAPPYNRACPS
jgi:hypothetical protein